MFNFNVDLAIECIKSVNVNTQCVICDSIFGPCMRFPCGHSTCEDCARRAQECLFCNSSPSSYVVDKPQSSRITNAAALLKAFQDTFKIDVYKRKRVSDHLKVEKLVFPECIQAPHKYSNKRKSSNISLKNKENISPEILPGEKIEGSNIFMMKKSVQHVQNWLNQYESMPQNLPRRPFGDINVNTQSLVQRTQHNVTKLKNATVQANRKQSTYRKRSHLKSISKKSSLFDVVVKSHLDSKKPLRQLEIKKEKSYNDNQINYKCDKNESGIVLDDEPIIIEDIDTNNIDKDKQAWLAVLEAAEKDEQDKNKVQNEGEISNRILDIYKVVDSTLLVNTNNTEKLESNFPKNVLFYKKSSLLDTCNLCNCYLKNNINTHSNVDKSRDVSIIINNAAFITTIKISHCEENKQTVCNKSSIAIQTDIHTPLHKHGMISFDKNTTSQKRKSMVEHDVTPRKMLKVNDISQSLDAFTTEKNTNQESNDTFPKQHECLIIDDSDVDSIGSCDNTHEIVAEVHRSTTPESVECGILRRLSKMEYEQKTKRQKRGHTPNSSNSSDKENLDPNRKKIAKLGKKTKNKKQ